MPDNAELSRKIVVAGQGGKSTLARALAVRLGLPCFELDAIHWLPNWTEISDEDFQTEVQRRIDENPGGWVIDGNYNSKLRGVAVSQAETIVYVDMPWRVWFWRVFWRSMRRGRSGEVLWNGNRETLRDHFFSRESMIWFMLKRIRGLHGGRSNTLKRWAPQARVIRLDSAKALSDFYIEHGLKRHG